MAAPNSTIYICKGVRLDNRYNHTIYFDDENQQFDYFLGKTVKTYTKVTYLRKSWTLQVETTMDEAIEWSYLFFTNNNRKKYFYFINNVEYKNEACVELTLELDVIQTYLFDFNLLSCYVERIHADNDVAGQHTVDEGLELGELIDVSVKHWVDLTELCVLVLCSINPNYPEGVNGKPVVALSGTYDNVFSGLKVFAVEKTHYNDFGNLLDDLAESGFLDGIINMWMYPKALVKLGGENVWGDDVICKIVAGCSTSPSGFQYGVKPTSLGNRGNYVPKNNKLLTYPYSFLYVSNNMGDSAAYHFERFQANPIFAAFGSISPDGTVKMSPAGYNGLHDNDGLIWNQEYGLTLGNFPSCAWDSDVYKLWLAQNQNVRTSSALTSGLGLLGAAGVTIGAVATGNIGGAIGGLAGAFASMQQVSQQLAQQRDMAIQPPQAKGSFSANVNITTKSHTFSFYHKSITSERARVIDGYFTMYGYKVNRVMTPTLKRRENFTYIKTVGCTIAGDICNEDLVKIENIFDKGVTFWVNGDTIGDYNVSNNPLNAPVG